MGRRPASETLLTLLFTSVFTVVFSGVPVSFIVSADTQLSLPVHNTDTGLNYLTIQEAINAPETLDGHTIFVEEGTYYEHVTISKSLMLLGENRETTIIDGNMIGHVIRITQDHVTITGFTIQRSGDTLFNSGISISSAWHCEISGNRIVDNFVGIYGSPKNTSISNNSIVNNFVGVDIHYPATYNIISGNCISANTVSLHIYKADSNSIFENNMTNNWRSITIGYSRNNKFYHNVFFNNTEPVLILASGYANFWDDGYPSGGNYWSDCIDVDLFNGPNQDLPGMDGKWDHPYVIDADNKDRYPLVKPYPTIPVTVDIDPDTLNLKSQGKWITAYIELPEGYNVSDIDVSTVMLNDTIPVSLLDVPTLEPVPTEIGDYDVDGIPDLMVKFDRAMVESFIYNQEITYDEVSLTITGELFDGTPFEGADAIFVNYAGDANNDGIIDIFDVGVVSAHWYPGPPPGPLSYILSADFNSDDAVDIFDIGILSVNWGQTTPSP